MGSAFSTQNFVPGKWGVPFWPRTVLPVCPVKKQQWLMMMASEGRQHDSCQIKPLNVEGTPSDGDKYTTRCTFTEVIVDD